jgi:hypothetical protein
MSEQQYAGFWIRVMASIIDTIFLLIVLLAIVFALYSAGLISDKPEDLGVVGIFLNYIIPLVLVLIFGITNRRRQEKLLPTYPLSMQPPATNLPLANLSFGIWHIIYRLSHCC